MTVDIEKLKALALAASPGPWRECGHDRGGCGCGQIWSTEADMPVASSERGDDEIGKIPEHIVKANAAYIAAACPATVLELIAEVERLREGMEIAVRGLQNIAAVEARAAPEARDQNSTKTPETRMDAAFEGGPSGTAPAAETEKDALRLAKEAMVAAQRSHGLKLTSYPPQDAWMFNRVDDKLRAALKAIDEVSGRAKAGESAPVDCRKIGGDLAVTISQSTAVEALAAMKAQAAAGKYKWLMADDASFVRASMHELELATQANPKAGKEQP